MVQALMVAGTVMQVAGQIQANQAQARAERLTSQFFFKQAEFARDAMFRELAIADREYTYRLGAQVSAAAKGGADVGSGSIVNNLASTMASKVEELLAIKRKGELDMEMARLRGAGAASTADTLSSASYNLMQSSSTILTNVAKSSDSWNKPGYSSSSSGTSTSIIQPDSYQTDKRLTIMRTA